MSDKFSRTRRATSSSVADPDHILRGRARYKLVLVTAREEEIVRAALPCLCGPAVHATRLCGTFHNTRWWLRCRVCGSEVLGGWNEDLARVTALWEQSQSKRALAR